MANGCVAAIRKGCELYKEVKGTVAAAQKTVKEVTAIAEEVGGFFGFFKKKKPKPTATPVAAKAKKAEAEIWDEVELWLIWRRICRSSSRFSNSLQTTFEKKKKSLEQSTTQIKTTWRRHSKE